MPDTVTRSYRIDSKVQGKQPQYRNHRELKITVMSDGKVVTSDDISSDNFTGLNAITIQMPGSSPGITDWMQGGSAVVSLLVSIVVAIWVWRQTRILAQQVDISRQQIKLGKKQTSLSQQQLALSGQQTSLSQQQLALSELQTEINLRQEEASRKSTYLQNMQVIERYLPKITGISNVSTPGGNFVLVMWGYKNIGDSVKSAVVFVHIAKEAGYLRGQDLADRLGVNHVDAESVVRSESISVHVYSGHLHGAYDNTSAPIQARTSLEVDTALKVWHQSGHRVNQWPSILEVAVQMADGTYLRAMVNRDIATLIPGSI